ncbi:MAG TPA: NAD(P)H-hydrate dehydratase [Candidatus Angelobacter sp.]|nr:NAD(P)H-hydrate dehydratase [Candidatus Angelobacter sp.]
MRILFQEEVRQLERDAEKHGLSELVLMEAAGTGVANFCLQQYEFNTVCVVCGRGNNGGDGLVAATALQALGREVSVLIIAKGPDELKGSAGKMLSHLPIKPIWISKESDLAGRAAREALSAELIVDAVVGTGFKPPLKGLNKHVVDAINECPGFVVSVDLPSGIDGDISEPPEEAEDAVMADGIVTFIAPRPAHVFGNLCSGPIAVHELVPATPLVEAKLQQNVATAQDLAMIFPPRADDAHKGDFGHVLVIAGSLGKAGAAALSALGALRTGAGLVTVACPKSIQSTVAGFAPELMTEGLEETAEGTIALAAQKRIDRLLTGKDAIVLGPGLSQNEETSQVIRQLVGSCPLPLILDADGLNAFAGKYGELRPRNGSAPIRVLTPHPGEAARLVDLPIKEVQGNRIGIAKRIAVETGSCVVLKGWRTVVADPIGEVWINMTGNAAMAKAGSGDVLSGMIAAALARNRGGIGWAGGSGLSEFEEVNSLLEQLFETDPDLERIEPHELEPNFDLLSSALKTQKVAAAVHLHGLAGDFARIGQTENSVLASHILRCISDAFSNCEEQVETGLFYLSK